MTVRTIKGRKYVYRSVREGKRVRSIYVGPVHRIYAPKKAWKKKTSEGR